MKRLYLAFILFACQKNAFSQSSLDNNYISWSATRKLTVNDFIIKTGGLTTNASFAQFTVDYKVNGFDFMTKNFNKKVHNYVIRSASWVDTTYNIAASLRYQQTLWDICEIYTRRFRQELKTNKRKIATGTDFISEINAKIMSDFSSRRMEYDIQTQSGSNIAKQKEWETQIQKELDELDDFALK